MRLIVISEGLAGGGAVANVAWQQALGLSCNQQVLLISDGLSSERKSYLEATQERIKFSLLKVPRLTALRRFAHLPRQILWILLVLRAVQAELQGARAAVICHSHPLAAAMAWCFGSHIRLIMVSHGDIFHRPPGSYDPAITWLYRRTTAYAHQRANVSVALSPVMVQRIQAHGVPFDRIALIPNGIDPAEIGLEESISMPEDFWNLQPLRLLFVGRLDPVKGVDVLLKALALAKEVGMELQLDVIGSCSSKESGPLKAMCQQLGLAQNVHWLGSRPRSQLAFHYRRCHLVVVPSLDDPLPTVVLEAMTCGKPVLGSEVGGISYMVQDGINGLLVPPGQPTALLGALKKLDQDRALTAAYADAALQRSKCFCWTANVNALRVLASD